MLKKKQIREMFRLACLKRDGYRCAICDFKSLPGQVKNKLDIHHITDRNDMPGGGYVSENGITLCQDCHLKAELFHISGGKCWHDGFHPDKLYKIIGSSYDKALETSYNMVEQCS